MNERTSKQWYDAYVRWGGCIVIYDPDGWDRRNWEYSWFEERITAEEFLRRANRSTQITAWDFDRNKATDKCRPMGDLEYYFTCVVREDEET